MTTSTSSYPLVPIADTQLRVIKSAVIGQEYQVKIRLPENYASATTRYPVLYLLDADHAFGMAADIVQYLIYGEHIPDLIIAGPAYDSKNPPVEGGKNMRGRDLAPFATRFTNLAPGASQYLQFFQQELIPFVESNYRVVPNDRTLWGYSMGGAFALLALFTQPTLFQRYLIVDGFWIKFFETEETYAAQHQDLPAKLIFASAPDDVECKQFVDRLNQRNYPNFQAEYVLVNDLGHFAVPAEGLTKGLVHAFAK